MSLASSYPDVIAETQDQSHHLYLQITLIVVFCNTVMFILLSCKYKMLSAVFVVLCKPVCINHLDLHTGNNGEVSDALRTSFMHENVKMLKVN